MRCCPPLETGIQLQVGFVLTPQLTIRLIRHVNSSGCLHNKKVKVKPIGALYLSVRSATVIPLGICRLFAVAVLQNK